MIVATVLALLAMPLIALRGKTLVQCWCAQATLALFAWIVWRRLLPQPDPRLASVALAVFALVVFVIFLARGANVRWSANRAAILAGIVYALVIAFTSWKVDGDEPYYLLITESMMRDGDLDLANQYRELDRTASGRTDLAPYPKDPKGPHGEQYSRLEPFLSLLMLPGYLAGGLHGALAVLALFGMLLVRSTIRWMEDEGIRDDVTRAVFPFFAFAPPVLFYATRMWPEVPAAFFFVEAVRGVRGQRAKRWLPALIGLVLLKLRFGLVAFALIVVARRSRKALLIASVIVIAAAALLSTVTVHELWELRPADPINYLRGLFGLLVDGMSGIAFQAPFYLLGIAALFRWRETPRGFRLGILASLLYLFLLLPRAESFASYGPPLRYIVFLMPVLALGAAAMWDRIPRGAIAIAAAWTIGLVIHRIAYPWHLFHEANGENSVSEWLSLTYRADFSRLFPSFIRINDAAWIGAAVVLALLVLLTRRAKDVALTIALAALVIALGFRFGREPGATIHFEDAHVVKAGGHLEPRLGTPNRGAIPGGWVLQQGDSLVFRARAGTHELRAITGLGATIELDGHAYFFPAILEYRTQRVTIAHDGETTLRCLSGAINVDRMELVR